MSILVELLQSISEIPAKFAPIATHDPLAATLLVIGGLIIGFAMVVFGLLSVGAVLSLILPESGGETYPPAR